jgi:hypothetical protein
MHPVWAPREIHLCKFHTAGNVGGLGFVSSCKEVAMMIAVAIAFVVLIGPLAVLYGVDSRIDDRRDGWPNRQR